MCAVHGPKDVLTCVPFFSLLEICRPVAVKCSGNAARRLTAYRPPLRRNQRCKKRAKGGVRRRGRQQGPTNTADLAQGLAPMIMSCGVDAGKYAHAPQDCRHGLLDLASSSCMQSSGRSASHVRFSRTRRRLHRHTPRKGWSTKERYDLAPVSLLTRPHDGRCSINTTSTQTLFKLSFFPPFLTVTTGSCIVLR